MTDDLPPEWLATLRAIVEPHGTRRAPALCAGARAFGATAAMVAAGWIERYEDDEGKVGWTLSAWAAERLGFALVERDEPALLLSRNESPGAGETTAVWTRVERTPGGWQYPDPPLVAQLHPRTRWLPDAAMLNIPDPHSDPARAEARRRAMRRRKTRKDRRRERMGEVARKAG